MAGKQAGAKKADGQWRRRTMSQSTDGDLCLPVKNWTKADVLAYLQARRIPVPASSGRVATGIDLTTPSLLWLHDEHPADFERLRSVFPLIQAVIERRRLYGVGEA